MAKISELTDGSPAQAGDEIPVARNGANFRITAQDVAALSPQLVQRIKVTGINPNTLLAAWPNAVQLIPAPGPNRVIIIHRVTAWVPPSQSVSAPPLSVSLVYGTFTEGERAINQWGIIDEGGLDEAGSIGFALGETTTRANSVAYNASEFVNAPIGFGGVFFGQSAPSSDPATYTIVANAVVLPDNWTETFSYTDENGITSSVTLIGIAENGAITEITGLDSHSFYRQHIGQTMVGASGASIIVTELEDTRPFNWGAGMTVVVDYAIHDLSPV